MVYMAKVDSALTTTVTGLKWFKIYEDGLDSNGVWAVTRLVNNKGKVNVKIPSCIPSGNYLLRAELIALHPASSYPGAQFYMECAQINVTGGGSASPSTVSFPGAYKGSDPGITINVSVFFLNLK
jgi:Auxiliary Activity family 9 (formerly GH61)